MSIFNELLLKLFDISNNSVKAFNDELQAGLVCLDKFEEEYQNGRGNAKEKAQKDKTLMTTLQSIHEDDDESNKNPETSNNGKEKDSNEKPAENSKRRVSKKRSKDEVEGGLSSPEQDKRQKRNASVKAQSIISKQEREILKLLNADGIAYVSTTKSVNVNLTQKLRREDTTEKKSRRHKEDDKENAEPVVPVVQVKLEKMSIPPEVTLSPTISLSALVKQETADEVAMPPPSAPVPRPRKTQKDKEKEKSESVEEESGRRRTTRTRKQTDTMPPPAPVSSSRSTRASSRSSRRTTKVLDAEDMPPPEARPKRTRAKKKISEPPIVEADKVAASESVPVISPDKPRPKRTRRGKNAEKEQPKPEEPQPEIISPKEERISEQNTHIDSPVLKPKKAKNKNEDSKAKSKNKIDDTQMSKTIEISQEISKVVLDDTAVTVTNSTKTMNVTVTLDNAMDKTVVIPNGVYNHEPLTPKNRNDVTVVLESNVRETMTLDKHNINDATVVIEKLPKANVTDDNSILTDDNSETEHHTPPKPVPVVQPTSAVKEKVQQFEELAARTTRTKTRAMAKMDEPDNQTPPDKIIKPVLSQDTINKMNNMIFNGKTHQISSSAVKPSATLPPPKQVASASKVSSLAKYKEAAEESIKREKEDARKKKEALLEAKRELQRKKREEKMANAAAARSAAERERKLAMEMAQRERVEKQMHADMGKMERLKEVERKKQELARKVAETEERRRAEEHARMQRLAEEQRRAEQARRKQIEEAEAMKKEAALMAKEIEKRQKEYMEKQKLKQQSVYTKGAMTPGKYPMEPVYMCDGFQYLNSDEDEEPPPRPVPAWSTSKARKTSLVYQSSIPQCHIDALFSVRIHSPDLREIFPNIERTRLKRTSSAVWRTPPRLPALAE